MCVCFAGTSLYISLSSLCVWVKRQASTLSMYLFTGVQKLVEVYRNKPNFADAEAQEDTKQRLHHVRRPCC